MKTCKLYLQNRKVYIANVNFVLDLKLNLKYQDKLTIVFYQLKQAFDLPLILRKHCIKNEDFH